MRIIWLVLLISNAVFLEGSNGNGFGGLGKLGSSTGADRGSDVPSCGNSQCAYSVDSTSLASKGSEDSGIIKPLRFNNLHLEDEGFEGSTQEFLNDFLGDARYCTERETSENRSLGKRVADTHMQTDDIRLTSKTTQTIQAPLDVIIMKQKKIKNCLSCWNSCILSFLACCLGCICESKDEK